MPYKRTGAPIRNFGLELRNLDRSTVPEGYIFLSNRPDPDCPRTTKEDREQVLEWLTEPGVVKGRPQPGIHISIEQLEEQGYIGIYRKEQSE